MRIKIAQIKENTEQPLIDKTVVVKGWVRTVRQQKSFAFIELNDGSTLSNLQIVVEEELINSHPQFEKITTGASIAVKGQIAQSPGKNQSIELKALSLDLIGTCDPQTYPLQKKRHSLEFLRTIAHLRPRTNTIGAMARVRNALSYATHLFFQQKGFLYLHTPIITGSDCEGAGKMFQVTTLIEGNQSLPSNKEGKIDYSRDFFSKPTFLTVSGQLNGEAYACALSDIYTFGPTFRAENSNTSRHLAEFWMIEPEMAFAELKDNMECAEQYLKFAISHVLTHCEEDLVFFDQWVEKGLLERLHTVVNQPFQHITYTEAVAILQQAEVQFEFALNWGDDLQSEHERYLTEEHFKKPVIVTNYPKEIKSFYMRANDDGKTVAAMDILVPRIGEIIGGSQREERLELLEQKMKEMNLPFEEYRWYLDLRRYGTVPHAGFGLGFERLVRFATGIENIRDVIPFPRYPGNAEF